HNHEFVLELLTDIYPYEQKKYFTKIQKIKAIVLEQKGLMNELYLLVVEFLHHLFQHQIPSVPLWVAGVSDKYFKQDFAIKLHLFGITLLKNNQAESERLTKELILSCFEKASPKGTLEKIGSIGEILKSISGKGYLEIYQNFVTLKQNGITEKNDYKKL